ncbi:hypothetical protein JCM19992_30400 [Thermostilla marina]
MSRPPEAYTQMPEFPSQPVEPPQQGMSPGAKTLLIVLAVLGGLAVLCCGGFLLVSGWFGYKLAQSATEDPAEIVRIAQSICPHELPDGFRPDVGMDVDFPFDMKMASFVDKQQKGTITFMLVDVTLDDAAGDVDTSEFDVPGQEVLGDAEYRVFLQGTFVPVNVVEDEDLGTFTAVAQRDDGKHQATVVIELQLEAYPEPRPIVEEFLRSINRKAGKNEDIRNPTYLSPEAEPATAE